MLKLQNNSFSFGKIINLQLDPRQLGYLYLHECEGVDEVLIQYIQKKRPEILEVHKCKTLIQQLNAFSKLDEYEYNYSKVINFGSKMLTHCHPTGEERKLFSYAAMTRV